jgi:hypothetical protein
VLGRQVGAADEGFESRAVRGLGVKAVALGAQRVSKLRRYVPSSMFDKQIRKLNQLAA